MPEFRFGFPDGKIVKVGNAESLDQAFAIAQQQIAAQAQQAPPESAQQPPSLEQQAVDNRAASAGNRFIQGLRDPIDAGAQLLTNMLPNRVVDAVNSGIRAVNEAPVIGPITKAIGMTPATAQEIGGEIAARNREIEDARARSGNTGVDWMRMAGNIASPATFIPGVGTASGLGVGQLAAAGARSGAIGGLLQPVTDPANQSGANFWANKSGQVLAGGATGAVATPILGKTAELIGEIANRATGILGRYNVHHSEISARVDEAVDQALKDLGQMPGSVPNAYMNELRAKVREAMQSGRTLDPRAQLRADDFTRLGFEGATAPTRGQLTRDPAQFALEKNLRADPTAGAPLLDRLTNQNARLAEVLGRYGGSNAQEATPAGRMMASALQGYDERLRSGVNNLYQGARDEAGRYASVNIPAFSNAANDALQNGGLRYALPAEAERLLNAVSTGKIPLNVDTVTQIDATLSGLQRSNPGVAARAIGEIRTALNNAPIEDAAGQAARAAFDTARSAARTRFSIQDAIPALKAAANGETVPDTFVRDFVINAPVGELRGMAQVFNRQSPEAFNEARNQVGAYLQRAAFGENAAGDKVFSPERFSKAIRDLGTERLSVFFAKPQVEELQTLSRVGAYIHSRPGEAPVMGNPNMSWAASVINKLPGVSLPAAAINAVVRGAQTQRAVSNALTTPTIQPSAELSPEARRALAASLMLVAPGLGAAGASGLR